MLMGNVEFLINLVGLLNHRYATIARIQSFTVDAVVLAGWDNDDIKCNLKSLNELAKHRQVYTLPFHSLDATLTSDPLFSNFKQLPSLTSLEQASIQGKVNLSRELSADITATEFEQLSIQLARTIYTNLSHYERLLFQRAFLNLSQEIFLNLSAIHEKTTLVFRVWPHLFSDYCLFLSAKTCKAKSYLIEPLKGLSNGIRNKKNATLLNPVDMGATKDLYYVCYDILSRSVIPLKSLSESSRSTVKTNLINLVGSSIMSLNNHNSSEINEGPATAHPLRTSGLKIQRLNNQSNLRDISLGRNVKTIEFLVSIKQQYQSLCSKLSDVLKNSSCNENLSYIYFPFPKQPEASTMPFCGGKWDIGSWLYMLQKVLPTNIIIVCKEHPDQYRYIFNCNSHFIKNESFPRYHGWYNEISQINQNKIKFISTSYDCAGVMSDESCIGVMTMNGSALYQARKAKKICIVPDNHWGQYLFNVHTFSDLINRLTTECSEFPSYSNDNQDSDIDFISSKIVRSSVQNEYNGKLNTGFQITDDILEMSRLS